VKKIILMAALLALTGCMEGESIHTANGTTTEVHAVHDEQRRVTCWIYQSTVDTAAISCLPDKAFQP
jgi:hypothetical protein